MPDKVFIKKWQDEALTLFSGDGDPNEYLLENYEYYLNEWINEEPVLRKIASDAAAAGDLKSEDEIRMFIIAFRSMAKTLAVLKTFSKFDWEDLAVVMDEDEYEAYKSWYLYFRDSSVNPNPPVPVPVDVDFDIELVRTDLSISRIIKSTSCCFSSSVFAFPFAFLRRFKIYTTLIRSVLTMIL